MATENVTPRRGSGTFTLALGFGRSQQQAADTAAASLRAPFPAVAQAYASTWDAYDQTLSRPPQSVPGQSGQTIRRTYYLDANVLKASEDKTFPGAVVASLASPWGQAVNAGDDVNGKAAADTGGDQLDETAYPILMAYLTGLGGDNALWTGHINRP